MKKAWLTITALALLAGAPALVRAGGTNSPGTATTAAVKPYPLKYCLVSGEKLGEMGKPVTTNYMGQEFKFCCKGCVKDFQKDPAKFLKKLAAEEKKAKK